MTNCCLIEIIFLLKDTMNGTEKTQFIIKYINIFIRCPSPYECWICLIHSSKCAKDMN